MKNSFGSDVSGSGEIGKLMKAYATAVMGTHDAVQKALEPVIEAQRTFRRAFELSHADIEARAAVFADLSGFAKQTAALQRSVERYVNPIAE